MEIGGVVIDRLGATRAPPTDVELGSTDGVARLAPAAVAFSPPRRQQPQGVGELVAGLGQLVAEAKGAFRVGPAHDQAVALEVFQAGRQDVRGHAVDRSGELAESLCSIQQGIDDE